MGLYDREYYREEESSGLQLRAPRSVVTLLIIVNVACWLLDALLAEEKRHWLVALMAANSETLSQPWTWWKFLTYGFAHNPAKAMHIIGNMFSLWCFGYAVEARYGKKEFATFFLGSVFVVGLLWGAKQQLLGGHGSIIGASGAVTAVLILFVLNFPKQTIFFMGFFPMPAWVLGVMLVLQDMLGDTGSRVGGPRIAYDAHLFGAAIAAAYFFSGVSLSRWLPISGGFLNRGLSRWQGRPSLRVHSPDDDEPRSDLAERADKILAKLHEKGDQSLTAEERRVLEDYSRRMRQKHR